MLIPEKCKFKPETIYMRIQPDITEMKRSIFADWLSDVAEEYILQQKTFYVDRIVFM